MSSCTEAPGSLLGLRYWGSAIGAPLLGLRYRGSDLLRRFARLRPRLFAFGCMASRQASAVVSRAYGAGP